MFGGAIKATLKTGLAALEIFSKVNPVVGLITSFADMTGLTDWLFDWD